MKRREILELSKAIERTMNFNGSVRFVQGLLYNKTIIKDAVKTNKDMMKKLREPLKEYDEIFEKERNIIIIKYGTIQENGNMVIKPKDENYSKYVEDLDEIEKPLAKKYRVELDKFNADIKDYEPILDEEVEFKPYTINSEDFPNPFNSRLQEVFFNAGIIVDPIKVD